MAEQKRGDALGHTLLRAVEQSLSIVMVTDTQGIIEYVNPKFSEITGYSREEAVGTSAVKLGETPPEETQRMWNALNSGGEWRGEFLNRKKNGERYWESASISAIRDEEGDIVRFVKVAEDVTERKRGDAALRESEERFRQLAENIREVFWLVDPVANRVLYVSPAYETVWGRTCKSAYAPSSSWLEAIHPEDRGRVETTMGEAAKGPLEYEFRVVRPDGSIRQVQARAFPIQDETGNAYRVCGISMDVTERRAAEEAQARLAAIVESSGDAIIGKTLDGTIVSWNPAAERLYGYTRGEAIGALLFIIVPTDRPDEMRRILETVRRGEHVRNYETLRQRKDGTLVHVSLTISPVRDASGRIVGASTIARDITDIKRAQEALQESEERFRQLAENIREVFWMTDPEKNQMVYISPGYEAVWGRRREDLYASPRSWLDAIHPDDRSRVLAAALSKQVQGDYDEEYRIVRPDGSIRWIRDRAFPIKDPSGRVYRVAGIAEDITERKRAEDTMQHLYAERLAGMSYVAGLAAHEINNPVSVVMGHAYMAQEMLKDSQFQKFPQSGALASSLMAIDKAARQVRDVARSLLNYTRPSPGAAPPMVNLHRVIEDTLLLLTPTFRSGNVSVVRNIAPELPRLAGDPRECQQVLMNLLLNAQQAMPQGGTVTLTAQKAGDHVEIAVADTGVGMSPEVQKRLFEPFFTTKPGGTGLGLALVRSVVQRCSGNLAFKSEAGKGTVFTLHMPIPDYAPYPRENDRP